MFYRFRKIAEKYNLWDSSEHLLVAVSGGLDSMVLLDLCRQLYNPISIVHCNFGLRGDDSNKDEALVREITNKHKLLLHCIQFDTKKEALTKGISIEMAARDLRYNYFDELCSKYGYTKILTAHHSNDNAETVLLNITKGTGIKGLTGIPRKRGNIVRPLLEFTREELASYATEQELKYREDKTNYETIFQRNKIRHQILPLLKEINPSIINTLKKTSEILQEGRNIYEDYIYDRLRLLLRNETLIISELVKEKYAKSLLYEWITPYGFSSTIVENILSTLEETEEKIFYTTTHRLIKSRGKLQLTPIETVDTETFYIEKTGSNTPINLKITPSEGEIIRNNNIAYFDCDKLQFPLILRRWKKGDRFFPFGMKGTKKVSELFKDKKASTLEKEATWILCSGNDIIWVIGLRADNRYRITENTKNAIRITWEE